MFKGKLLRNLVLISTVLITVYTVGIIVLWFQSDLVVKSEKFERDNQNTIDTLSKSFDDNLIRVVSLCEQISKNKDVVSYATEADVSGGYAALNAVNAIGEGINNFSNPDCLVGVMSSDGTGVAMSGTSISIDRFDKFFGISSDELASERERLRRSKSTRTLSFYDKPVAAEHEGSLLVFYNRRINGSDFTAAILIDENYLFGNVGDNAVVCRVGGKDVLVCGSDDIDYARYEANGDNCYYNQSAAFTEISFLMCSRNYAYIKDNYKLLGFMISAGVLLLVLIIFVLAMSIRRIYRPMGDVVNRIKEYSNLENNDEAYIVGNNFDSLKNRNEELAEKMKDADVHMREKAIGDILRGVVRREKAEEIKSQYGLEAFGSDVCVTVVEIASIDGIKNVDAEAEIFEINNTILRTVKEQLKFRSAAEFLRLSENRMAILTVGYGQQELKNLLTGELTLIEAFYSISLKTATGSICDSLFESRNSYLEAVSMLEHQHGEERNIVNSASFFEDGFFYYPLEVEHTLVNCVRQGDAEKTALLLENIIHKNYSADLSESLLYQFKASLAVTLKRLLQLFKRESDFKLDEGMQSEDEFLKSITAEFLKLISDSESIHAQAGNRLMASITEYIKENYSSDISLTDISERYDISSGYISKLFRENLNTTFKDYLNRYRIGLAKEMIQKDINVRLLTVAESVGFTNAITFNRVFKKYENQSPSEYKESLLGAVN